jgi:photosystem I subunit 2
LFNLKLDDDEIPSPIYGGSTGGWLLAGGTEEKYAMTFTSPKEQIFEMPTAGSAIMQSGENLVYFAKKEQALALGSQLKSKFKITNYQVYRLTPGNTELLHPRDGVFPEKVNAARVGVGNVGHSIGKNLNPIDVKFTEKRVFDEDPIDTTA